MATAEVTVSHREDGKAMLSIKARPSTSPMGQQARAQANDRQRMGSDQQLWTSPVPKFHRWTATGETRTVVTVATGPINVVRSPQPGHGGSRLDPGAPAPTGQPADQADDEKDDRDDEQPLRRRTEADHGSDECGNEKKQPQRHENSLDPVMC